MKQYLSILKNSNMFNGINDNELLGLLKCLNSRIVKYKKGDYIIRCGDTVHSIGMVLSGGSLIQKEDYWGKCTIIQEVTPSYTFAESYAFLQDSPSLINVVCNKDSEIMFFDIKKITTMCSSACSFHTKLINNLLSNIAKSNINLTKKIDYMTKKNIRERLLSYLSNEYIKNDNSAFEIPFNRQQLAEYLSVDRSALSNEISKLQKEGIITSKKNKFYLHDIEIEN